MKKIILIFLIAVFISVIGYGVTRALEGEGLTISPPISELTLESGKMVNQTIRLTNPTENLVEVYPKVMNFRASGEGGEPDFFEEGDDSGKFSLAKWITFNQSKIALAPEQVVEFKYTIEVPEGAEPGGHYGVVFFATEPPENEEGSSQVALGSMIGSLVLVRVPGQIVEKAVIEDFKADKKLYFKSPSMLTTRIANLGNVHFKPKGEITIKGWFGAPEEPLVLNEQGGNVLPDSTRRFENEWKFPALAFGYFNANANITYGESEKSVTESASFWIIPWWLIAVLIAVIAVITFFIVKRKQKSPKKIKTINEDSNNNPPAPEPPQRPILR
jgi:hypothetical protein